MKILTCGAYIPKKILTNLDLEKIVDTSDKWIQERTGIKERRIEEEKSTASMALAAVENALSKVDDPQKLLENTLGIIVATSTPDYLFPSTACLIQGKLIEKYKLKKAPQVCFDILAACSGFIYAVYNAYNLLKSSEKKYFIVVGSEKYSKIVNWKDRSTCILFGDAAGCAILEKTQEDNFLSFDIGADGRYGHLLYVPCVSQDNEDKYLKMKGNEVFKIAVRTLEASILKVLKKANKKPEEISFVIPHQANIRILKLVAERIKIPLEKFFINIEKLGNTSAASIPLAMNEAIEKGIIKRGDLIILTAFGGGFTWGSVLLKF